MNTTTCGPRMCVTFRLGGERKTSHRSGGLPSGRGEAKVLSPEPPLCLLNLKHQRNNFMLTIFIIPQ